MVAKRSERSWEWIKEALKKEVKGFKIKHSRTKNGQEGKRGGEKWMEDKCKYVEKKHKLHKSVRNKPYVFLKFYLPRQRSVL